MYIKRMEFKKRTTKRVKSYFGKGTRLVWYTKTTVKYAVMTDDHKQIGRSFHLRRDAKTFMETGMTTNTKKGN